MAKRAVLFKRHRIVFPPHTTTKSVVYEGSKYSDKHKHTHYPHTQHYDVIVVVLFTLCAISCIPTTRAGPRVCSARGETQLNHLIINPSGAHVDTAMIHKVCANVSYSEQEADMMMMSQTTPQCAKHPVRDSIGPPVATARTHQLKGNDHPTSSWRWVYVCLKR